MARPSQIHINTARQDLAGVCDQLIQDTLEAGEEGHQAIVGALQVQKSAILKGTLHAAKVNLLARAYALEDFANEQAAQCDRETEALDAPEEADEDE